MTYATLSSKNQITLPVANLRHLGLKAKDRLEIRVVDGQLVLRKAPDFLAMKGRFKGLKRVNERSATMEAAVDRSMGTKR